MPSTRRRLASGLVALAAIMGILTLVLPGGQDDDPSGVHLSALRPWAACVRDVRSVSRGAHARIAGPSEIAWEASGTLVEMVGALSGAEGERRFACRAVLIGPTWRVEQMAFGR